MIARSVFATHTSPPSLSPPPLPIFFPTTAATCARFRSLGPPQVAQVLNQLTIEYGPKSAQLLDGALMPFIHRTYQLTPGAGSTTAAAAAAAANGGGAQQQAGGEGSDSGGGGWPNGTTARLPAVAAAADGAAATGGGAGAVGAEAQQLLAHEVAERAGFQKLCFSVIQHVSSNGLAGVLSSPTNAPHLDGVLRSVVDGLSDAEDASTKKTCLYIFSLLLGGFNRGRSGGVPAAAVAGGGGAGEGGASANGPAGGAAGGGGAKKGLRAAATQRRALSGKGGGLWTGSGPTVDMEPGVQSAVTAFVCERAVPAALKCLVDGAPPTGLDLRDAAAMSAIVNMGALLKEAREASGGSARFVGVAALACSCTPQVWGAQQEGRGLFRGASAGVCRRNLLVVAPICIFFCVCVPYRIPYRIPCLLPRGVILRSARRVDARTLTSVVVVLRVESQRCLLAAFPLLRVATNTARQVAEQLQLAVEGAADGPAIATALKVRREDPSKHAALLGTCFDFFAIMTLLHRDAVVPP